MNINNFCIKVSYSSFKRRRDSISSKRAQLEAKSPRIIRTISYPILTAQLVRRQGS